MKYESMKVKEAMQKISGNEIYLPAIQRKFVWGADRIERLFDSIMRDYPIGTFLFWNVKGKAKDEYTFYKFIQDFHERDNALNTVAPKPDLREEFTGVLDGQQRLNSMYVALQGSYAFRQKWKRANKDDAFPKRELYLNLFFQRPDDDESGVAYQFKFLTQEQAQAVDDRHFWFKVKDVLVWLALKDMNGAVREACEDHPEHEALLNTRGRDLLTELWQRLCSDEVINYYPIQEQELDRIVDIFVRVNSAGVQLTKTDLLFSSIVAHWDNGRDEIEELIKTLNKKGSGFSFDNDFVMRSCLVLTDLPVRFKVNSFKKENIDRIKQSWPGIKKSLESAADLLVEWGFSAETLPTLNSVVPIAYFAFKDGDVKADASKADLRQYLVRALLNQIFTSNTDRVLGALRDHLRVEQAGGGYDLKSTTFVLSEVLKVNLPANRTLKVTDDDIDDFLSAKKGPLTFLLLSLLYPHLKFNVDDFHQDHIHPWSTFKTADLTGLGLDQDKVARWQDDRDRLPNLQLMDRLTNISKNATPFETWIQHGPLKPPNRDVYEATSFIPPGVSLELSDFEAFYDARRDLLKLKLKALLVV